jgi:heme-degrading monooxygenase HmoA
MAVVKINAIDVPTEAGPELERRFAARMDALRSEPGFLGFELLRPTGGESRYFVYSRWETEEDFQAWAAGPSRTAHGGQGKPVSQGSALLEFEVALKADPAE